MNRKRLISTIIVIGICAMIIIGVGRQFTNNNWVLTVDGYKITEQEYLLAVDNNLSRVHSLYKEKLDNSIPTDQFWNTNVEGTTPKETIIWDSMESVIQAKIIQLMALEENLITSVDFTDIQKNFEKENIWRQKAFDKSEPIYGPKQYTIEQYYNSYLSDLKIKLKDIYTKKHTDKKVLKKYYTDKKETLYKKNDFIEANLIIENNNQIVSQSKLSIDDSNVRAFQESNEELFQYMQELKQGETLSYIGNDGQKYQLTCTKRVSGGYYEFEEVIEAVMSMYAQDLLEEHIKLKSLEVDRKYNNKKIKNKKFLSEILK